MNATNQFLNASIGNALLSQKVLNRGKRHESYVGIPSERERCYRSLNIDESAEESCKFVWNNPNCLTLDPLIEYLRILVCHLEVPNNILGICFILFFALFFIVLYSTFMFVISKYFLLPNSLVLLTRFKMKEYSFGSGVLALIFTVPEIMSNILTCFTQHRNYAVLYSARVGKTVHCLLFGVGLICVFAHGRIDGATLMRDIAFTAVGFTFTYGVMRHEMHNLRKLEHQRSYPIIHICAYMSLLIFLIYLVNVLVFSKRNLRKSTLEREMEAKSRNPNTSEQDISIPSSSESFDSNEYPHQAENPIEENVDPIAVFLKSISPFHNVDGGPLFKLTLAPFFTITAFLVPVVRPERQLRGWCKIIFCTSFISVIIYVLQLSFSIKIYIGIMTIIAFCLLLIIVFTHQQRIPKYHDCIAFWGLCLGFLLTTVIEVEWLVLNWQIMNYVFDWTDDAIILLIFPALYVFLVSVFVLTILNEDRVDMAFGLIMGLVLVHVYSAMPSIAFSSCFTVTEFLVISAGTTMVAIFMFLALIYILLSISLTGFELRRSLGVFYFIMLFIFDLHLFLSNSWIIHPYGSMHSMRVLPEEVEVAWA